MRCVICLSGSGARARGVRNAPPARANTGKWTIDPRLQHKLEQLHTLCRQEVERPDELTKLAIEQLHIAIDVTVARLIRPKTQPPEPSVRMELAIRWTAQNLAERNPVRALCEYLQVSPEHWPGVSNSSRR